MSEEKQEKSSEKPDLDKVVETSRRDFNRKVTIAGAASVAGASAVYSGYRIKLRDIYTIGTALREDMPGKTNALTDN